MSDGVEVITIDGGAVNAYLLKSGARFVLVDTLIRSKRALLDRELANAGCTADSLGLIVVTHADPDHTGSCVHLRDTLHAKIGMHALETPASRAGDMAANRGSVSAFARAVFAVLGVFFRPRPGDRFEPDVVLNDGDDLRPYGVDARILHLPGHSLGSIGVLTRQGDLICGDLATNRVRAEENSLADDPAALHASAQRARELGAKRAYPGHGRPFDMSELKPRNA